ncbi:SDR family NAD(P)-dependent oxidoreductase [Sphingobium sp. AN558]|uniref:SDR family NAD(P)-dependent oxidoreductase n=1 Tax=Sphingobium sp. AN558 TaxID=3133442 RepID=UPI0030C43D08
MGGAGGVGSAVVDMLAARGDTVTATVLDQAEADRVMAKHGSIAVHQVDLSDADLALDQFSNIIDAMPTLDAVAMCAAIAPFGPTEVTPLATFRKAFEINVMADIALFQAAMPALRKSQGRLVLVTSIAGRFGMPILPAYTCSKFALEGVAEVMRLEVAQHGVKVSMIEPGGIKTPMVEEQIATALQRRDELTPEHRQQYGHLYDAFARVAREGHDTSSSTAEQIAAVVISVLDSPDPEMRYVAGDSAQRVISMLKTAPPRDFEAMVGQMFGSAGTMAAE